VKVFDVLEAAGKDLLETNFDERRTVLKKHIKEKKHHLELAEQLITGDQKEAEKFYKQSLDAGNEGVMVKNLHTPYKPGSRVGYGVKVKPVMETLDVVITGAEWGEGKRSGWLTSYTVACIDEEGEYQELGKVGTGIKELEEEGVSFKQLTDLLRPLITSEKGKSVRVKPKIVIELKYEEIQKSNSYSSGYALRFPRFVRLREDRRAEEISDLEQVEELFVLQRGRN